MTPLQIRIPFAAFSLALGGYMLVYGMHAFLTGDYFRPSSGPYAGKLGLWVIMWRLGGIDPHAPLVKAAFVALGIAWLVHAAFIFLDKRNKIATVVLALLTVWYLPLGTLIALMEAFYVSRIDQHLRRSA